MISFDTEEEAVRRHSGSSSDDSARSELNRYFEALPAGYMPEDLDFDPTILENYNSAVGEYKLLYKPKTQPPAAANEKSTRLEPTEEGDAQQLQLLGEIEDLSGAK